MLKGLKKVINKYSLDETKFLDFAKKNKEKYGLIEFKDDFLIQSWNLPLMINDFKKTLNPVEKKSPKNLDGKKK